MNFIFAKNCNFKKEKQENIDIIDINKIRTCLDEQTKEANEFLNQGGEWFCCLAYLGLTTNEHANDQPTSWETRAHADEQTTSLTLVSNGSDERRRAN